MTARSKLRLGISACLLGERVRWDGGDKRAAALLAALAKDVEWVPVCPEMAIGLGAPREPVRLVRSRGRVRLVGVGSGADHTEAMERWARGRLAELGRLRLHGFVLKAKSPSCGLSAVKIHDAKGRVAARGRGAFAAALVARLASMPVEDEERLADPARLAAFVDRAWEYEKSMRSHG